MDGGKFSAHDSIMFRNLASAQSEVKTYDAELWTVLPPSKILVPPGPPSRSFANR